MTNYPRDWVVLSRASHCPFCHSAITALRDLGYDPKVTLVYPETPLREFMGSIGLNTVPQVWHNGQHVWGWEELKSYLNLSEDTY